MRIRMPSERDTSFAYDPPASTVTSPKGTRWISSMVPSTSVATPMGGPYLMPGATSRRGGDRHVLIGLALALACFAASGSIASAEELQQVVSLEHPSFDVVESRLAIGLDGRVYLASDRYVLHLNPDGSDKQGSVVTYALQMVAANADGIIATANAHFNHSLNLWTRGFEKLASISDFLVNDQVDWQSPTDVEAGPSGDFYALDPNRNRVVRVAPPGRIVTTYPLDGLGEDLVRKWPQLRVWERSKRFFVLSGGVVRAVGFDGRTLWSLPTRVIRADDAWRGGFDVDDDGRVFVLEDASDTVQIYDGEGRPASRLRLRMGERKDRVSDLRVFQGEVFVKRRDPRELFDVYDGSSGALKRVVFADTEELDVTFPNDPWIAGVPVPLPIRFISGRGTQPPVWRAWLRPFGVPEFEEAPLQDGRLTPPADAGGLYTAADLRRPSTERKDRHASREDRRDSRPAIEGLDLRLHAFQSPLLRRRRGPFRSSVVARGTAFESCRLGPRVRLTRGSTRIVAGERCRPSRRRAIPRSCSEAGADAGAAVPGRYMLTSRGSGIHERRAGALEIGPGIEEPPIFSVVQHGDYTRIAPDGNGVRCAGESRRPRRSRAQARREHVRRSPGRRRRRGDAHGERPLGAPEGRSRGHRPRKGDSRWGRTRDGGGLRSGRDRRARHSPRHGREPAAGKRLRSSYFRTACGRDHARHDEPLDVSRLPRVELGGQLVGRQARGRRGRRARGEGRVRRGPREGDDQGHLEPCSRHRVGPGSRAGGAGRATVPRRPAEGRSGEAQRDDRPVPRNGRPAAGHVPERRRGGPSLPGRADPASGRRRAQRGLLQAPRQARLGPSRALERRRHRRDDPADPLSDGDAWGRRRRLGGRAALVGVPQRSTSVGPWHPVRSPRDGAAPPRLWSLAHFSARRRPSSDRRLVADAPDRPMGKARR